MHIPLQTAVFGFIAVFVAGLTMGLTGFGLALIASPLLVLILPPKIVVPVVTLHGVLTTVGVMVEARKWLDLRRRWPLMLAGGLAVPFGAYLLVILDAGTLKVLIGAVIALTAVALLLGFRHEIRNEKLASGPVGLLSGLLNGSTGMGGPPIVLFFANQGVEKQVFRANLAAYFFALKVVAIPSYLVGDLITPTVAAYSLLFLPALLEGMAAGIRLAGRVPEELFRRFTLLVVCAAGLLSIAAGLRLV